MSEMEMELQKRLRAYEQQIRQLVADRDELRAAFDTQMNDAKAFEACVQALRFYADINNYPYADLGQSPAFKARQTLRELGLQDE